MCSSHTTPTTNLVLRQDPTRTKTIRDAYVREVNRRFTWLQKQITETIVTNDAFGLNPSPYAFLEAAGNRAFQFPTTSGKVGAFMAWLDEQEAMGILEISQGAQKIASTSSAWQDVYLLSSYKKGISRATEELFKAGKLQLPLLQSGGLLVEAAFNRPIHADRVGLIYTRAYRELRGITEAMDQQISGVLAQGLVEGRSPKFMARQINLRVDKIGKTRARVLARTETIRAHHSANMATYREAQLEGVNVMAELSTAGDPCPVCEALSGKVYTLDEAEGLIPIHGNCRCVCIPANVGETRNNSKDSPATVLTAVCEDNKMRLTYSDGSVRILTAANGKDSEGVIPIGCNKTILYE